MPSYLLGPVAGSGTGTYWSTTGDDARSRLQDQGPLSFGHHQLPDQVTIATSSGMNGTSATSQQRHQVAVLSCVDRQLNCNTPRESHAFVTDLKHNNKYLQYGVNYFELMNCQINLLCMLILLFVFRCYSDMLTLSLEIEEIVSLIYSPNMVKYLVSHS